MSAWQHILVVARNNSRANDIAQWLRADGYPVTVVSTFTAARAELSANPALVITEVKLGEFNGLHLAIKAGTQQIPVLVVGESDPFFEKEAQRFGAQYLSIDDLTRERLVAHADSIVHENDPIAHGSIAWLSQPMPAPSTLPAVPVTRRMRLH